MFSFANNQPYCNNFSFLPYTQLFPFEAHTVSRAEQHICYCSGFPLCLEPLDIKDAVLGASVQPLYVLGGFGDF